MDASPTRLPRRRLRRVVVTVVTACSALVWASGASADPPADKVFGFEASFGNPRILEYDIIKETSTTVFRRSCVPPDQAAGARNGRGIALDERQGIDEPNGGGMKTETRILYTTSLLGFAGDGLIHRNRLPIHGCRPLTPIPFGEGPGPPNQDDIGALDFHDVDDFSRGEGQDEDVLYAAGYLATSPTGFGFGPFQILYKVDAETGAILGRCSALQRTPGSGGNDTITFARLDVDGDGTNEDVLLTDFGEFRGLLAPDSLAAVLEDSLTGPPAPAPARPCEIVAEFPVPYANAPPGIGTGIDYEPIPKPVDGTARSLVVTGVLGASQFWDANGPPFTPARLMGSTAPSNTIEDITVARVNKPEDDDPPPTPATEDKSEALLPPSG